MVWKQSNAEGYDANEITSIAVACKWQGKIIFPRRSARDFALKILLFQLFESFRIKTSQGERNLTCESFKFPLLKVNLLWLWASAALYFDLTCQKVFSHLILIFGYLMNEWITIFAILVNQVHRSDRFIINSKLGTITLGRERERERKNHTSDLTSLNWIECGDAERNSSSIT